MSTPLADTLRPQKVEDVVGQQHILGKNKPLNQLMHSESVPNMIFYGPPGTGKTTIAKIISKNTDRKLYKLNATTASTQDLKNIFSQIDTFVAPNGVLLYLDEIQYFNKKQQQSLLEFIENGKVVLIASTTENPYFYIYNAILSRSVVFEFKSVPKTEIKKAVIRAVNFLEEHEKTKIIVNDSVLDQISSMSGGDVRRAINTLELIYLSTPSENGEKLIDDTAIKDFWLSGNIVHDKTGDAHYDLLSAFQKSMRGSDQDAAVYYLARLLECGELIAACRRLMVCACEDVGLAYPQIIPIVKSSVDIAMQVGMPEARIPLADAVILVALSPKSNSAYIAVDKAARDIQSGKSLPVPRTLQNVHCDGVGNALKKDEVYKYPHDFENNWIPQQYLPDEIKDNQYYFFGNNKTEQAFKKYTQTIKKQQGK